MASSSSPAGSKYESRVALGGREAEAKTSAIKAGTGDVAGGVEGVPPEAGRCRTGDALGVEDPYLAPLFPGLSGEVQQVAFIGSAVRDPGGIQDLGHGHGRGLAHAGAGDGHQRVLPGGPHHAPTHDVTAHLQAAPVLGGYGRSLGVDVTPQAALVPGQQPCPAVDVDRLGLPVPDRAPNQHCQDHQYYPFADRPRRGRRRPVEGPLSQLGNELQGIAGRPGSVVEGGGQAHGQPGRPDQAGQHRQRGQAHQGVAVGVAAPPCGAGRS